MSRIPRFLPWLWVLVCALSLTVQAAPKPDVRPVYTENAGQGATLPYFDAHGFGLPKLRWSDIEARLGKPEEVKEFPYDRRTGTGGQLQMLYPSLGLSFEINSEDNDNNDPRIGWLKVNLPQAGATPQGLYLGMPQAEGMAIIERLYKVRGKLKVFWGHSGTSTGLSVLTSNHGWRKEQSTTFIFREQRLFRIEAQMKPTPLISLEDVRALLGSIIGLGLAALIGVGMGSAATALGPWWRRVRSLLGVALLGAGVAGAVLAFSMFAGGDGYSRLAGLMIGIGAIGLLFIGLLLLTFARNSAVSGLSKGILAAAVLLVVVASVIK